MAQKFSPLKPKIVLGIAAHPDDLDFGAAGALAKFAAEGAAVHYLILTDGSKGSADPAADPSKLVSTRKNEQKAGLDAIGGKTIAFLDYEDGRLEVTMDLKRDIIRHIRKIKPDVVVTMDPSVLYSAERGMINHPDHRAAGQATLDAVFPLARDHLSFPELAADGYEPHKVSTLLLINFNTNNYTVDISKSIEKKMNAIAAHASQMPNIVETQQWLFDLASEAGEQAGYRLGEAFVRLDIRG